MEVELNVPPLEKEFEVPYETEYGLVEDPESMLYGFFDEPHQNLGDIGLFDHNKIAKDDKLYARWRSRYKNLQPIVQRMFNIVHRDITNDDSIDIHEPWNKKFDNGDLPIDWWVQVLNYMDKKELMRLNQHLQKTGSLT